MAVAAGLAPWQDAAADSLKVTSQFEGGSGVVQAADAEEGVIRLVPTPHRDRGWVCWWYVRVDGAPPGKTLTLDVGGGVWATPDRAAYSTDNQTWHHTEPGQRIGDRIVYRIKAEKSRLWLAWGPPYVPSHAQRAVQQAAAACAEATDFELCRSRHGRPVPAVRFRPVDFDRRPPKHGIWVQARQHAWESGSSWVGQGLLDWLVSNEPAAIALRQSAEITVVPVMDIDSVADGAGGKEQKPQDHNRDWTDQPHWPEVRAAMRAIREASAAGRMDLFVDLHNPGPRDRQPFFFVPPRSTLGEVQHQNVARFLAAARQEITGPLKFEGMSRESGPGYDPRWQAISKNWVSAHATPHVVAVTLETAWNTPHSTQSNYRRVGAELGRAMARYLQPDADPPR